MVAVVIGLSLAAGALFLLWMVMRGRAAAAASSAATTPAAPSGNFIDRLFGIGQSMANTGNSYGQSITNGVTGLASGAIKNSTQGLTSAVNIGGQLLTSGNQVGAKIASTTGSVIKGSITAPLAAVAPITEGVKTGLGTVVKYSNPVNVVKGVGGAAQSILSNFW